MDRPDSFSALMGGGENEEAPVRGPLPAPLKIRIIAAPAREQRRGASAIYLNIPQTCMLIVAIRENETDAPAEG